MPPTSPTYTYQAAYDNRKASYWDGVSFYSGTTKVPDDPSLIKGSKVQVTFARSEASGVREDVALFDLHFGLAAGGAGVWDVLSASDAAAVETALDALWTTLKPNYASHWTLKGYIWRHIGADQPLGTTGLSKPSPVWRQTVRTVAGTASSPQFLPDQVSMDVTFVTCSRRHWGRCYLPPPIAGNISAESRFSSALCDIFAGAFDTLFTTTTALSRALHPLVWSPKYRGLLNVAGVQCDDVPDIIRRRRPKVRTYRKTFGLVT